MGMTKGEKASMKVMLPLLLVVVSLSFPPYTLARRFPCRYHFYDCERPRYPRSPPPSPPLPPPDNPLLPPPEHPLLPPPPPKCGVKEAPRPPRVPPPPPPPSPPCPTTPPTPPPPPHHYCRKRCYGDDYERPYLPNHPCWNCPPRYEEPPFLQ